MNMEINPGMKAQMEQEREKEEMSWEKFNRPLTLGFADEAGAVLVDEARKELWYLDINTMSYRQLKEKDLTGDRAENNLQYDLKKGTQYENGATAAVDIRKKHLETQLKIEEIAKKEGGDREGAEGLMEILEEELGYLNAYLNEPEDQPALTKELNEMYQDMRSEETETETQAEAA